MNRTRIDLSFLLFVCVFVLAVQFHDHALWFQLSSPYAASTTREVPQTHKEPTNPPSTHNRSGIRAARPRCPFGTYEPFGPAPLVSASVYACWLV